MINVTKTYLPDIEEYNKYLQEIWKTNWVTNEGPLLKRLEQRIKKYLQIPNMQITSNGTIALQIAIKALELKGEIITTPFSYVATTNSILWENCKPVFVDIDRNTFCINAELIESAITPKTSAILATHVYGFPCDVEHISSIAKKYHLKVIYDGAHAFGIKVNGKSIFNYGDISTLSFHATKLFHTIEGGAIIAKERNMNRIISLYKTFGHQFDKYFTIGINGKTSEFHAAMGLCVLGKVNQFVKRRKIISEHYRYLLDSPGLIFPDIPKGISYNYAYFPVIFKTEGKMLTIKKKLLLQNVNTRRYFYPSLNTLPFLPKTHCPVSEDISKRVLCLPLYPELEFREVEKIAAIILKYL